ncbi:uncharacterized protein LOC111324341 isoform X2 [Stylophora pistillata]|uniref:uncharacterized protein LOC111324341 isoform X2 n=1 Tax=Stylophora pistillata TaxID=50429 RepID=UPI000C04DF96|nr:uncharacterized protein LOC111324341 isoform X2 [Stylophora pistillata]
MSRFLVLLSYSVLFMMSAAGGKDGPISPKKYQSQIRAGFSTNWFKTEKPMNKYSEQNIKDVHDRGFSNLRIRCRADLYSYDYSAVKFKRFLGFLTTVVDHSLKHNVIPIISWIHHRAEAYATKKDHDAYVAWWTAVAQQLKDRDYRLSFNLFTELGIDTCKEEGKSCDESLRVRTDKYNQWTKDVTKAIRGPNKVKDSQKFWSGDGKSGGQANVEEAISYATTFSKKTGLLTYLGAWMPQDNTKGNITETEAIKFSRFFVEELRKKNIPWSLNVLDN